MIERITDENGDELERGADTDALQDAVTLAIARADGQDWDTLDDAPSRGEFMGYPSMAEAALKAIAAFDAPPAPLQEPNPTPEAECDGTDWCDATTHKRNCWSRNDAARQQDEKAQA